MISAVQIKFVCSNTFLLLGGRSKLQPMVHHGENGLCSKARFSSLPPQIYKYPPLTNTILNGSQMVKGQFDSFLTLEFLRAAAVNGCTL